MHPSKELLSFADGGATLFQAESGWGNPELHYTPQPLKFRLLPWLADCLAKQQFVFLDFFLGLFVQSRLKTKQACGENLVGAANCHVVVNIKPDQFAILIAGKSIDLLRGHATYNQR